MVSKEDIEKLFDELLSQISNSNLREKVVKVWLLACERGGWNSIEELKKIPFTLLIDSKGVDLIEHTIAVTK
ncbi:phosphohydrolase, partial [candidate division WOR-3 bacterium]|nr:phosphohydrolase [candidate division WOR-3 bacterium]